MLFTNVDKKLEKLGFKKVNTGTFSATYERVHDLFGYTHVLDIRIRDNGVSYIQSYDKDLFDTKGVGNTCVALTYVEASLASAKARQLLKNRLRAIEGARHV